MLDDTLLPPLRSLDIRRIMQNGAAYFHLRDPLELSEQQLLMPVALGPLLVLLDGTRSLFRLRVDLALQYEMEFEHGHLTELVATLAEACLLEDERYAVALRRVHETELAMPVRPPALAGRVYPEDPAALTALLRDFERQSGAAETEHNGLAGLISPHIDYARGGPVYGALWRRAAPAIRAAEVAVIFGTDHMGSAGTLTLSRRPYATPWGILPADQTAVEAMAAELGERAAFAEEIHHRREHSVELAAVWLHHVRDGLPCTVIPVLCGPPLSFMQAATGNGADGGAGAWQTALRALDALRRVTAGRRVVAIAAADLAHVGPAFGDPAPFSAADKRMVRLADHELLDACAAGPLDVLRAAARVDDRYRICGLSPIALTLAFTGPVSAEPTGYDQCPADEDGGSIVSIAGVLLRRT